MKNSNKTVSFIHVPKVLICIDQVTSMSYITYWQVSVYYVIIYFLRNICRDIRADFIASVKRTARKGRAHWSVIKVNEQSIKGDRVYSPFPQVINKHSLSDLNKQGTRKPKWVTSTAEAAVFYSSNKERVLQKWKLWRGNTNSFTSRFS